MACMYVCMERESESARAWQARPMRRHSTCDAPPSHPQPPCRQLDLHQHQHTHTHTAAAQAVFLHQARRWCLEGDLSADPCGEFFVSEMAGGASLAEEEGEGKKGGKGEVGVGEWGGGECSIRDHNHHRGRVCMHATHPPSSKFQRQQQRPPPSLLPNGLGGFDDNDPDDANGLFNNGHDEGAGTEEYEWGGRFRLEWDSVPLLADFFPAALAERAFFLGACGACAWGGGTSHSHAGWWCGLLVRCRDSTRG